MKLRTEMNLGQYRPYPPTNNAQVEWVKKNIVVLQRLSEPPPDVPASKQALVLTLGRFLKVYLPMSGKGSDGQERVLAARNEEILKALTEDLARYPLWAVEMGLKEYRQTPEGKWAPKTSGEVIPFIQSSYARVSATLKNCRRILGSAERGLNVDEMEAALMAMPEGKMRADTALDMMNRLEKSCNIWTDEVGRPLHTKCYKIFHDWRRAHAKEPIPTPESETEDAEAGTGDADRGIQPLDPADGAPKA